METIALPPVIAELLDELTSLCREFGVARLEVFGSAVTAEFNDESSDLDFLVTYPPDYHHGPWGKRWLELEKRLSDLFDRPVDLLIAKEFRNPYFARSVERTRRLVYAA